MKFFAYNADLDKPNEFGSFTVVARKLNEQFKKLNVLGDINNPDTYVIFPEVFATEQRWKNQIPYLACEYSLAPDIVIQKLKQYNPLVLAISEFAKQNIINSGYEKVDYVHLGTDPELWKPLNIDKFDTFTYLTVNSSNERSGFEKLIPAFIEFCKDKNVKLIIKDGNNSNFKNFIESLNHPKIEYIDKMAGEDSLRVLYNKSHIFLYTNNTTSFGMNPMDAVLCGTPSIVTYGSALKEFIPDWTQPVKIHTQLKQLNSESIDEWTKFGINCFSKNFLNVFNGPIYGEIVNQNNILEALEFSFKNYKDYAIIAKNHKDFILEKYTWEHCARNLINKIYEYKT
jgi:glycosyltransferase involved in cell wall biosynthesis